MRNAAAVKEMGAKEMAVKNGSPLFAAVIGLVFPAIFFAAYLPVSLFVGDILPGAVLYAVLFSGVLLMGFGTSLAKLSLWRKALLFGFLTLAYAIEILALALLAIGVSGFEGVF